jgi:hypothetical protein
VAAGAGGSARDQARTLLLSGRFSLCGCDRDERLQLQEALLPHTSNVHQIRILLDLFAVNRQLNVYAGEVEVRPPQAPTTVVGWSGARLLENTVGKHLATFGDRRSIDAQSRRRPTG